MACRKDTHPARVLQSQVMFPRPLKTDELALLTDIDGTVQSSRYLHLNRSLTEFGASWSLEPRDLRERLIDPNRIDETTAFAFRQIVGGIEEGIALCIELQGEPVAALVAQPRVELRTLHVVDLRVDFDYRRQGLGTALGCAAINCAREGELRAVTAETRTDNFPAISFLKKLGFEPAGLDTHRLSNHDLVKERATLLWCLALD